MKLSDIYYAYLEGKDLSEINQMYKEGLENIDEELQSEVWKQVTAFANYEMIEHLIAIGWQPMRFEGDYGFTLLHILASSEFARDYEIPEGNIYNATKLLLNAKVSPLRKNNSGKTAIMLAAKAGHFEMLKAYLELEAKINFTDKEGNTLLHILAEESGHFSRDLDYAIADLNANYNNPDIDLSKESDVKRRTRLESDYHLKKNKFIQYIRFTELCMENGIDPYIKNEMNETALDVAVRYKSKMVGAILKGYDFNDTENSTYFTIAGAQDIYQACMNNDFEAVEALIRLGENTNSEYDKEGAEYQGMSPLSIAMIMQNAECIAVLLKNGAESMLNDSKSWHPFRYLYTPTSSVNTYLDVFKNKVFQKIVKSFIDAGFDINSLVDDEENTLLTISAKYADSLTMHNNHTIAKTMIEEAIYANAAVNQTNRDGVSALMYLCLADSDRAEKEIIMLLEQGASTDLKDKNGKTALMYAISNQSKNIAKNYCELLEQFGDLLINAKDNNEKSALDYAVEQNNENLVAWLLERQ